MQTELYFTETIYALVLQVSKKIGINLGKVCPNYIDPSAHFDGEDYSLITLGANNVISKDVLFLVHDYSVFRALKAIDRECDGKRIMEPITVGDNVFIGARVIVLPGTTIGNNVVVGAGAIVKGNVPSNTVVAGNPAKVIQTIEEYAMKCLRKQECCARKKL